TEQRLSNLQERLTASALGIAPIDLERRLGLVVGASAEAPDHVATFRRLIASSMAPRGPFANAFLVLVRGRDVKLLAHAGAAAVRSPTGKHADAAFRRAAASPALMTTRDIGMGVQRFGYLMSFPGRGGTYVIAAGTDLPANKKLSIPASSPDAGFNVAIYFGRTTSPGALVETNAPELPLTGTVSKSLVPFGSNDLTLVISPTTPLTGTLTDVLPWLILLVGLVSTLGLTVVTERLVRRRKHAERLAEENHRLYGEQRNVSLKLQRSLLPRALPSIDGVQLAAQYVPGETEMEVGGDWYSAITVDDHRFAFVVGDVSGRGLGAATVMANLRYTIRAYAGLGFSPSRVLEMAAREIDITADGHFATALIGLVDNDRREVTIANAGHPPALLVTRELCEFVAGPVGPPLGIGASAYESTTVHLSPNATLVVYTDGLIERRTESLEIGLQRLRKAATVDASSAGELLTSIVDYVFADEASDDDTAILAIRWLD
ncbi:MAG TPA: PP2C family protein-serine/threonine phosphatase, partial [Acidimicrobiales bacterium]|nr:PP2C family protein-serine/threonine phosphatase [Acidimicrobiales bacterium]